MAILDLKYQELREIQRTIEQDWTKYERELEAELNNNLASGFKSLKEQKNSFMQKKQANSQTITAWKNDILEREKNLKQKEETLNAKKSLLSENSKEKMKQTEERKQILKEEEWRKIPVRSRLGGPFKSARPSDFCSIRSEAAWFNFVAEAVLYNFLKTTS